MLRFFIRFLIHFIEKIFKFALSKQMEEIYEKGIVFISSEYDDGILPESTPVAIGVGGKLQWCGT
jgi:hypothetical protein